VRQTGVSLQSLMTLLGHYGGDFVIPEGAGPVNSVVDQWFCWFRLPCGQRRVKDRGQDGAPAA